MMTKDIRPTSGKVLQALFNILGNVNGLAFLDLFAGTGRVSRFARDRGACPVVALELLTPRIKDIRSLFSHDPYFTALCMDVRRGLSFLRRKERRFNVVFVDPPYSAGWMSLMGEMLFPLEGGVIAPGGIAVVEHSIREEIFSGERYSIVDRREYGDTVLTFLSGSGRGEKE